MPTKSILSIFAITLMVLAPIAAAGGPSPKYDPHNGCGNVAAAGEVVRKDTAKFANDEGGKEVAKSE
ncbi:hypothetical protein N0V91_004519 [Didymella pomorum]|uniref:Uncharacterized protein n=1 Tax=Didymella pomorum TaxID=749634 RepID=A0A9W8ZGC1_9PLEO|nr:hypothetical protein N0V91_004519 [Didymella pomorum]